jgi:hypothetical protein
VLLGRGLVVRLSAPARVPERAAHASILRPSTEHGRVRPVTFRERTWWVASDRLRTVR